MGLLWGRQKKAHRNKWLTTTRQQGEIWLEREQGHSKRRWNKNMPKVTHHPKAGLQGALREKFLIEKSREGERQPANRQSPKTANLHLRVRKKKMLSRVGAERSKVCRLEDERGKKSKKQIGQKQRHTDAAWTHIHTRKKVTSN